jgi:hypothetical protein
MILMRLSLVSRQGGLPLRLLKMENKAHHLLLVCMLLSDGIFFVFIMIMTIKMLQNISKKPPKTQ